MRASTLLIGLLSLGAASVAQCVLGGEGSGIGSAQASEFYSRKRVNGVWVTGRFSKAEVDGALRRAGARPKLVVVARKRLVLRKRHALRAHIVGLRPVAPRAAFAALPAPLDITLPAPPPVPLPSIAMASREEAGISAPTAILDSEHRERLRRALEAKAQELASRRDAPEVAPQPISMTYDYRTQVRTTVFQNGLVVRETLSGPPGPPVASRLVGTDRSMPASEGAFAIP